jgi:hypothetical protein
MAVKLSRWPFVTLAGGALLGLFLWWQSQQEPAAPVPPAAATPPAVATVPAPAVPPAVQLQLDVAPSATPLPALDASDAALLGELGRAEWSALLQPERLVRRIVATIDNLPRAEAPVTMWPVKPAQGWLITRQTSAGVVLAPENQARYDKHVAMLGRLPVERVVTLYLRYYPLFQQAYEQLGHPGAHFHDRLRIAIEDLLATPEPADPLLLAPDNVRYRFADPDLARRSAGQKILLRMGVAHTRVVKTWLGEFRQALARHERPIPPVERKSDP